MSEMVKGFNYKNYSMIVVIIILLMSLVVPYELKKFLPIPLILATNFFFGYRAIVKRLELRDYLHSNYPDDKRVKRFLANRFIPEIVLKKDFLIDQNFASIYKEVKVASKFALLFFPINIVLIIVLLSSSKNFLFNF